MRQLPLPPVIPPSLITTRVNTYSGEAEDREMRTGRHTVRDVYCRVCHTTLGWKYVSRGLGTGLIFL